MTSTPQAVAEIPARSAVSALRPALRRHWWLVVPYWLLAGSGAEVLSWSNALVAWAATPLAIATTVLPIAWAALAIGGCRGRVAAAVLVGLAAYWAWWFGWQDDGADGGMTLGRIAEGLGEAAFWHLRLTWNFAPVVVVLLIAVSLAARWRRRSASSAMALAVMALAVMALIVLAVPRGAAWNDGCNAMSGSAPAITGSATTTLMDHGIGVMPIDWSTLAWCDGVSDRTWRPLWQGDDGLPVSRRPY